jgi:hypothetical protein
MSRTRHTDKERARILPKSGLDQALQCVLGQWPAMQTFLEDDRVDVDNNDTGNDIRSSAVVANHADMRSMLRPPEPSNAQPLSA